MARITLGAERFRIEANGEEYRALETGDILYFPLSPPLLPEEDRAFLVTQKQVDASYHKNISYRPIDDRLKGIDQDIDTQRARVHAIMRGYSQRAIAFMASFLERYAAGWKIDYASFRPIEESGRQVALHSRNDLLHFDSFPTRPSHGDRLLRIFTNIHPERARVWITTDHFEALAGQFADRIGLDRKPGARKAWKSLIVRAAARLGLPVVDRPFYDKFMLKIHHAMKEDAGFQRTCRKDRWEFPAGSTWIVFTDSASHACLSGQYALEQTFIVRRSTLVCPEKAPIAILEKLAGYPLARTA
ncbi:MAG: Kdo hydroxylase family protein [Isosphaerales bacterium]